MPTLDRRERALSAALGEYPHAMADLPVGDILCEYDDGAVWVACGTSDRPTTHS